MSAFLVLQNADCIELLTDGAVYDENTGVLTDIREKVSRVSSVPAAVTGRGDCFGQIAFVTRFFDNMTPILGGFDGCLDFLIRKHLPRLREGGGKIFEIVIAGISGADGPIVYRYASFDDEIHERYELHRLEGINGAGPIPCEEARLAVGINAETLEARFAETGALLMEMMRCIKAPNFTKPDVPDLFGIGGHVDHTIISAAGVTTTRLLSWDDRIGERIDPFKSLAA